MSKRKGNAEWKELKKEYWGQNVIVDTQEWGYIDFSPQGLNEVFGGEKLTYEEYLDAQMAIGRDIRGWFFLCHHEVPLGFAGQIERITSKNICFKRIYVSVCTWMGSASMERKTMFGCQLRDLRIIKLVIA